MTPTEHLARVAGHATSPDEGSAAGFVNSIQRPEPFQFGEHLNVLGVLETDFFFRHPAKRVAASSRQ
jgi:hypothetical protein